MVQLCVAEALDVWIEVRANVCVCLFIVDHRVVLCVLYDSHEPLFFSKCVFHVQKHFTVF